MKKASNAVVLSLVFFLSLLSSTPGMAFQAASVAKVPAGTNASIKSLLAIVSLKIAPLMGITTTTLPAGLNGTFYSAGVTVNGGTAGYTWSILSGSLPAGLSLSSTTGTISGTPSTSGIFAFTVGASDSGNPVQKASRELVLAIAPRLAITTLALPSGTVGSPYAVMLQTAGGTAPYNWSIASGSLPAGLSFVPGAGTIAGIPSTSGTTKFTVAVSDSSKPVQTASTTLTITFNSPLTINATSFASGLVGTPYVGQASASGGTGSYTWSVASGSLPAGLNFDAVTGTISGTPSTSGTFPFALAVATGGKTSQTAVQGFTITVVSRVTIASANPAAGVAGTAYSAQMLATGGTAPYTWSVASGSLPAGLSLSAGNGAISGTPAANGTSSFTLAVADSSKPTQTASQMFSITVASPLTIATSGMVSGTLGTPYSAQMIANGGSAPYTWSISFGSLPAGLNLSASTGVISGTPTASGTATFMVTVSDSGKPAQTTAQSFSIPVPTHLAITASSFASGTTGTAYAGQASASGGASPYVWSIASGSLPVGLSLSASTGAISGTPTSSGTFAFTLAVTDGGKPAQTDSQAFSITVNSRLAIAASNLTSATIGNPYAVLLQATGGTAPYTWSIASGSLPAGLNFISGSGGIAGVPTTNGTSTFTVAVTDSSKTIQTASQSFSIAVSSSLAIVTNALPKGATGMLYATLLQVSGGVAPYTWSVTSGNIPSGLNFLAGAGGIVGMPVANGTSNFTVSVTDSNKSAASQAFSLTIGSGLTIDLSKLTSGATGKTYVSAAQATGGTPGYTWSIPSGSLPAGLSLSAATGVISGTPSASGSFNFTIQVTDNSSPAQIQAAAASIKIDTTAQPALGQGTTWYVRPDGGTRYSANATTGQCDGMGDAPYPGTGVNQHCAFNDYRFLWDDQHTYGSTKWVISGGDTVILRKNLVNGVDAGWRVGFSQGASSNDPWCLGGTGPFACVNPGIPSGTAAQHTRILGENYASCSNGNSPNKSAMTQIFGGYGVGEALNLGGAQFVDVQCIEITRHSQCVTHGTPEYPKDCNRYSLPIDDYDSDGISTDTGTHDLLLQDMWVHGHTDRGIIGPIGGVVTANRIDIDTNGMAGWDFDNGSSTPSINATLNFNYSTIEFSGCNQEYPFVHPIPVISCYSQSTGGYGDGIGTPAGMGMNVSIDHSVFRYNTQDGEDFGHIDTGSSTLSITNSISYGNNGGQFKWGPNFSTVTFENNLVVANCVRMSAPLAGAPSTYNANLADFCRANDALSFNFRQNSNAIFANNTIVTYAPTTFDMQCADASCSNSTFTLTNNIVRAYANPYYDYGGNSGPGGYCGANCNGSTAPIGTINRFNNTYYGLRSCPAGNAVGSVAGIIQGETCADAGFVNEPSSFTNEAGLDNYNFLLAPGSSAKQAGVPVTGLKTDYLGNSWLAPPSLGGVEYGAASTVTASTPQ